MGVLAGELWVGLETEVERVWGWRVWGEGSVGLEAVN